MRVIIHEKERGLLFHKGRFRSLLEPGKYRTFFNKYIEVMPLDQPLESATCGLNVLLKDEKIAAQTKVVEVYDQQLALHYVNGKFAGCLTPGKYAFWTIFDKHEFTFADISKPEVTADVPEYIFSQIPNELYKKVEVAEYQKARLYFNNKLVRLLDAGTYYFWRNGVKVDVDYVDTRLTQMDITGQEILTQDKVALRINFVCTFRITDCVKVLTEIDNYHEQLQ